MAGHENLDALLDGAREAVEEFAQRNGIRRLSFFGSVLTEQFDDSSDVDVLVEFLPERVPGLLRLAEMEIELSTILGAPVDLNTAGFLHPRFREQILSTAVVYFEAA